LFALKLDNENALFYLNKSLKSNKITSEFVRNDDDWKSYLDDDEFIKIIERYKK